MDKQIDVTGKDLLEKDVDLVVVKPGHKLMQEAQLQYSLRLAQLMRSGVNKNERLLLRSELDKHLENMGVWTRDDAVRFNELQIEIRACECALKQGGIKLSEARSFALHIGDLRNELMQLHAKRSQFDSATMESVAENYRFNWLITKCAIRADNGNPYFMDVDDYLSRSDEPVAILVATTLAKIMYGYDDGFADTLPEIQWMKKYGFMDQSGRLTDRSGSFVDRSGRRVDENGRYIDKDGNFVDVDGNKVDVNGELVIDVKPFIDDETGELIGDSITKPKKRGRNKG